MKIYKYNLMPADSQTTMLPRGAKVLSVAEQYGALQVWALVDPTAPPHPRAFRMHGTGHEVPASVESWQFVGTVIMHGGSLVLHVFVEPEDRVTA